MASILSEECSDHSDDRCGSYSFSESESSCSFSGCSFNADGASSSMVSSPLARRSFAGSAEFPVVGGKDTVVWDDKRVVWEDKREKPEAVLSEVEMMKQRFAKLLLGEDMSGGGKGVCSALAISNAITNLSATVFGELWRLEPLAPQKKAMWCREMEYLLCVSDSIVELVPSIHQYPGGGTYEVMETQPRSDLNANLPALKKIDAILISVLDDFHDLEFRYVERGVVVADGDDSDAYPSVFSSGRPSVRQEEKWWLPCPRVPPRGLSEDARKKLQQCRDCTNQILKAALAINSNVLAEMEIPSAYLDTLPKNGKDCLGDVIYHYITANQLSSECLLDSLDLTSEHHTLEVANKIEAALHVWKLKDQNKHSNYIKSKHASWRGKVKGLNADDEKNHVLAQRAETLLHVLKMRFPGLPQTALDMNKIQYNKDVGQSILESYSRVMESLAFNILARIDDVLYVDDTAKRCSTEELMSFISRGSLDSNPIQKQILPGPFSIGNTPYTSPSGTPTFCSSPPIAGSPGRVHMPIHNNGLKRVTDHKLEIPMPVLEKLWSYAGNLSGRRITGVAPERY
ncbi:Rop guanine nucleotide exchange factor 1 [Heracleum sosnowskyi]|uniref:Rop guanine nucleotide exchange factor 1 n=1 Tax=Heracleum sosnowskyi TaxID=360622 RepID=A0AAD8MIM2_9APIA|nr:Rop guanine nucleotide exchange factor 1 [Heracleum sosnowskyi]